MGNIYFRHRSLHKYTRAKGSRWSGCGENDGSGAGEEGCEGGEKDE